MTTTQEPILQVNRLSKHFGGLAAVDGVDFALYPGEILSLIGPNGAGKTTVFNCITGIYRPTSGDILFRGKSLVGEAPHQIIKRGIARTFQITRLFRGMTVLENVVIAQHLHVPCSLWDAFFGLNRAAREARRREEAMEQLAFVGLADKADVRAENLSLGEQKRLELAVALTTRPTLLLLDEPAAGLNPSETQQLDQLIAKVRESGITVFLIEHDMRMVMGISDRIVVLNYGRKLAEGKPDEISRNPEVIEAYLGRMEIA
jgi:branched-chain amino acid transport system ATP-binding protein